MARHLAGTIVRFGAVFLPVFFIFSSHFLFSQAAGDYRSTGGGGNWSAIGSWQRYNGASWVAAPDYPGQNAGTGAVSVRFLNPIVLDVTPANNIGSLSIGLLSSLTTTGNPGLNVTGNLSITLAGSMTFGGTGNLSIGGTTSVNLAGAFTDNNGTGVSTFTGTVTISNGGSWTTTAVTGTANLVFKNGITNTGSTFSAGGATFDANAQVLGGNSAFAFANLVTVTGITLTNNGTVNMTNTGAGVLAGTGTWTQGATGVLNYYGSTITVASYNTSSAGNTVTYSGSTPQTIPAVTYSNLILSNSSGTSPQLTLANNVAVTNVLTMTSGNVDLAGYTLTLGSSAGSPGTLSYTAGWMYGGNINRWYNTVTIADGGSAGLYPIGTSADYRPMYISFPVTPPSSGGTLNVSYTNATSTTDVSIPDGASTIQVRHNAYWSITTGNGLAVPAAATDLRAEGSGLGLIGNVNDLRLMLVGSVIGTAGTNGGTTANPTIRRTTIPSYGPAPASADIYIGSVDKGSSPLPVNFLSIDAQPNGNRVDVAWSTAAEFNSDYFMVQHSQDGISFQDVVQVEAAGNSSTYKYYSAADPDPYPGTSYYRLKQVDNDGEFAYSDIASVNLGNDQTFSVYPNPASSVFNIFIEGAKDKQATLVVSDMQGKEYYSTVILLSSDKEVITIDPAAKLAPGVYTISAVSDNTVLEKRVVIK